MKALILFISFLLISSCTLCRYQALKDAETARAQGYEVRLVTYEMGFLGKAWGAFIWDYHTEIQVKDSEGQWRWWNGSIAYGPDFPIKVMIKDDWTPEEFAELLRQAEEAKKNEKRND